ncbi:SIR2 family protein [Flavobacterium sp. GSP11]|uniref:SIR2 family protein n=1 Tax=Flavobacterium sp. GSP11 TaxID=3401730 RepID=UPI003AAB210E
MTETLNIHPKIEDAIKKNNLVFFVGAGCSIPLGFPSWKNLIKGILSDLDNKYGEISSTNFKYITNKINNNTDLFYALSEIENNSLHGTTYKTKSKEFVNNQIDSISKNLPKESSVHKLLWEISEKIITTNYDKALEEYKPETISANIFDNTNAFQGLKSQSNEAQFLYKIHGDYENPNSIILFESDYKDIYKTDNHNNDTLATYFKDKTLLFIGFSLTDPFVKDLFTKIKTIYNGFTINEHFIFTTTNEDFTEYDVTTIQIKDWKDSLLEYLKELEKMKLSSKKTNISLSFPIEETKSNDELTNDDVSNIVRLIEKKTKELLSNPSDKELNNEVKDLRNKLDKLLFGKIDYLQEIDKPFRNADLQTLFDSIYSSQKLDAQTLERINKVRDNTEIYKWFERSVIVSAITCSLINFNKADEKKISLLIDFCNDNEEKVWQKAITSLFIVLNHLGYKWLKFNSIKTKIKSLNQNLRIQNSCLNIIQLFNIGLNNVSMVSEQLFTNSFFSENPFNYFLPYHQEDNPAFEIVYDTYEGNDIDKFISKLDETPIPDQLKYLICSKNDNKIEDDNLELNEDIIKKINKILHFNRLFYPYSIYVQEIISFYKYFPVSKHDVKLKSQLKLTETPLKDYLLNAKQKYRALGSYFMKEKNWAQAIINYKEAVQLDENSISDLLNLANCYHNNNNNKENNDEFNTRIKIQIKDANNEKNLLGLCVIYINEKKDYIKSLDITNQLLKIDIKNAEYFYYKGVSNSNLKEYKKAIEDFNSAIYIDPTKDLYYSSRGDVFYNLNEYEKSIIDLDIAISINEKEINYLINRSTNNLCLLLFKEALQDIERAVSLDSKNGDVYNSYSNYYRLIRDFDKAFEYIDKAGKLKKDNSYIGTKATIYASMGDNENFYKYLELAFIEGAEANSLYPDIKDKYINEPKFIDLLQKYNQVIF